MPSGNRHSSAALIQPVPTIAVRLIVAESPTPEPTGAVETEDTPTVTPEPTETPVPTVEPTPTPEPTATMPPQVKSSPTPAATTESPPTPAAAPVPTVPPSQIPDPDATATPESALALVREALAKLADELEQDFLADIPGRTLRLHKHPTVLAQPFTSPSRLSVRAMIEPPIPFA